MENNCSHEPYMTTFPGAFPTHCPTNAAHINAPIYRGCETNPSTAEDFVPHPMSQKPRKLKRCDPKDCNHWGLSVWVRLEDALHAQVLFDWAAKWHIFEGTVSDSDGEIRQTPARLPGHHTFWCYEGVFLQPKFSCIAPALKKSSSK